MAFFTAGSTPDDAPAPARASRRVRPGWAFLAVGVVLALVFAALPAPYVIQQPGPALNTLGTVPIEDGDEVELIEIPDQRVYPTEGSLTLLTVGIVGSRQTPPNWLDVSRAWFDRSRAVLPLDSVYPEGQTIEQSNEQNQVLMRRSQQTAAAAALTELGHDVAVEVAEVVDGSAADGVLRPGDIVLAVDGEPVTSTEQLQQAVRTAGAGTVLSVTVERAGTKRTVEVTPVRAGNGAPPLIGVVLDVVLPFEVDFHVEEIGGPSAGMMFALAIIDKLTPGALTGGEDIAGTGTVTVDGVVGRIGGVRQKLFGATAVGAEWFLAPTGNCDEIIGHVPDGLTVIAVDSLEVALDVVTAIGDGETDDLPRCEAA